MFQANDWRGNFCAQNSFGKDYRLSQAVAPNIPTQIVGIRPGEKIHEIMVPSDDVVRTIEFTDFYLITPAIRFFDAENDFTITGKGEKGSTAKLDNGYESGSNSQYLDV
jgi:UDP-N-acetylglucosamine 4,6-dehydratase